MSKLPKPETMLAYASILEKPQCQKWLLATGEIIEAACAALRYCAHVSTTAPAAEPGDVRNISDEMVQLACEAYDVAYVDDDMDKGGAMRAALKAARIRSSRRC